MRRTRVKFCGITNTEDALCAVALGADAIGLVFYPPATTAVDMTTAATIARALPPFVNIVALFVNAERPLVQAIVKQVCPSLLQFHGNESPEECTIWGLPYIKACRVTTTADIKKTLCEHPQAQGILLDAAVSGFYGGSGKSFDWTLIPTDTKKPMIVAGGLSATSVGNLIRHHHPWAVDVSSGIASHDNKRRKSWDKMRDFMKEVINADA